MNDIPAVIFGPVPLKVVKSKRVPPHLLPPPHAGELNQHARLCSDLSETENARGRFFCRLWVLKKKPKKKKEVPVVPVMFTHTAFFRKGFSEAGKVTLPFEMP